MSSPLLMLLMAASGPSDDGWLSSWSENLRWSLDESVRVVVDGDGDVASLAFLGLDVHKVLTSEKGDYATLTLQAYLTRVNDLTPTPPLFDGPDDWELEWRIFNANVKLRPDGSLNLRVGHFELPFGLEHLVNTNGTLRDYQHGANYGFKADWGVTLNGELDEFEYELAWSRGSGNEYRDNGDPGVISGRVGTPRDANRVLGLSFVDGDFRTPAGVIERERVGLDAMIHHRDLGFFAEVSTGTDGPDTDVVRALTEVNWRNSMETVLAWWQLVGADLDGPGLDASTIDSRLGVRWSPVRDWTLGLQYSQNLDPASATDHRSSALTVQLRYRF